MVKKSTIHWFILFFLLVCAIRLGGQDPFNISYSVVNGLPSNEVYDIISDDEKNIWISTDRGIVKYDGYDFENFSKADGLSDNTNFYFNKDKEGRIWVSGYNGTLSYIYNDSIFHYKYNSKLSAIILQNYGEWVQTIFEGNNSKYFLTYSNKEIKLFEFDVDIAPKEVNTAQIKYDKFNFLFEEKDSCLLVSNQILHFYIRKNTPPESYAVSKAIRNKDNQVIFHSKNVIFKGNKEKPELLEKIKVPFQIENLFLDKKNNLWVCTRQGLLYYKDANLQLSYNIFFDGLLISSIEQDFQGNFWVGTNDRGVKFFPSNTVEKVYPVEEAIEKENILSISKLDNRIYFGTSKTNLISFDKNDNIRKIKVPNQESNDQVRNIYKWEENSIITGLGYIYDGENFKYHYAHKSDGTPIQLMSKRLKNGDLMRRYTYTSFTVLVERSGELLDIYKYNENITGNFKIIEQDKNENIYIGTRKGLYVIKNYDYKNITELLYNDSLSFGSISDIIVDKDNILWVTTIGNGLFCLKNNEIKSLKKDQTFSNLMINNAVISQDSILWLASNNGIEVMSYSWKDTLNINYFRSISSADGLVSNFVNDVEYWNEYIWTATSEGICRFNPKNILEKEIPLTPLKITKFTNQDSSYNLHHELDFQHNENDILISYSGLSFQQFKKQIEYKYRLIKDGNIIDSKWYHTRDRNIRFTDLAPGKYEFEVSAKNNLRLWNDSSERIKFSINPHFTDTILFKFLTVLFFSALILLIVKIVLNRIRLKQKVQEANLMAIRNQMNPHFVFNSLNSIQNLIYKKDNKSANFYLTKFSTLLRQSLDFTRLDFISIENEIKFLTNYLSMESLRFPLKFEYKFIIEDGLDDSSILIPSLILQPIVENSIKHGFDFIDYVGKIDIQISKKHNNFIEIVIKDNGNGSNKKNLTNQSHKENSHNSLGLKMVRNRLDLLNKSQYKQKASIKTDASELGYQTIIFVPLQYDYD